MAIAYPVLAVTFLFLVLTPQMAVSGKKYPRLTMNPRTKKQLRDFFKDHATDMADVFPSDPNQSTSGGGTSNNNGTSQPVGGSNGGRSQAAATTAGKYIFSFDVGTPPQRVSGALDISSELVWTQCACPECGTITAPQPDGTLFFPSESSTMSDVPCTSTTCQRFVPQTCGADDDVAQCAYTYTYSGGSAATTGYLATETFTFDSSDPVNVTFGCGLVSVGDDLGSLSGVIGLGRGPYSLVSQLQAGRFSYHFAPDDDSVGTESFIHFGDDAKPTTTRAMSTPLLATAAYPNFYYVGLSGIRVDGKDLPIPRGTFDLQTTDGSSGVILSITIPVTFLDEVAYKVLRAALVSKIGLPTVDGSLLGLDLCYTSQSMAKAKIPALALVFNGNNAIMELQTWNYFYKDSVTRLECLAMLPSTAGGGSLLGNLIQAGTHMIYDVHGSTLTFETLEEASSPPPSNSSGDTSQPSGSHGKGSPMRSSSAPALVRVLPVAAANFVWVVAYMLFWAAF